MLKSYGGGGGPCENRVRPRSISFFFFFEGVLLYRVSKP